MSNFEMCKRDIQTFLDNYKPCTDAVAFRDTLECIIEHYGLDFKNVYEYVRNSMIRSKRR